MTRRERPSPRPRRSYPKVFQIDRNIRRRHPQRKRDRTASNPDPLPELRHHHAPSGVSLPTQSPFHRKLTKI